MFKNGDVYDGESLNGVAHGKGVFKSKDGEFSG